MLPRWLASFSADRRVWPWLIVAVVAALGCLEWWNRESVTHVVSNADSLSLSAYDGMLDKMESDAPSLPARSVKTPSRLRPFDPNTADSATLVQSGFRPRQARTLVHYRVAGGRFRSPADLARVYGLTASDLRRLQPYVRISLPQRPVAAEPEKKAAVPFRKKWPEKLRPGEQIDLSRADTALLQRIPGIGPYRARLIESYGRRLGGYVSPEQLCEAGDIPPGTERYVFVGSVSTRRLNINTASFKDLLRHPYLSLSQVKAIVNRRKRFGPFAALEQLRTDTAFTANDLRRLAPYLTVAP